MRNAERRQVSRSRPIDRRPPRRAPSSHRWPNAGYEGGFGTAITGPAEQIADAFRTFQAAGFTQLEALVEPQTMAALDAMVPVLEILDSK
jgi:hypothetical protein